MLRSSGTDSRRVLVVLTLLLLAYWPFLLFMDPELLRETFTNMAVGFAIVVLLAWYPALRAVIKDGRMDGPNSLMLSVFLSGLVVTLSRIQSWIVLAYDRPAWLFDYGIPGFIAYSVVIVCAFQIYAAGKEYETQSILNVHWKYLTLAACIGSCLLGVYVGKFVL